MIDCIMVCSDFFIGKHMFIMFVLRNTMNLLMNTSHPGSKTFPLNITNSY